MSAYLHYGMVSPLRIAREASAAKAEKFLDELLIWRELAYNFCFHREDHDRWTALPEWAQATLTEHQADRRDQVFSWEQLARGRTGAELWDAAQLSLLRQGELHNNVRMTWGKAILNWSDSPRRALELMIDLNHRYALDGRDPASYGGLLWCLGQFDRPFQPEQPIFGSVRPRPIEVHAQRLDAAVFRDRVSRPRCQPVPQVAVIGAGISGLFAARTLADHGLPVRVFEKSRGVGGRMATRRVDGEPRFDHGAQYFTVRDPRFRRYVDSWIEQQRVRRWGDDPDGVDRIGTLAGGTWKPGSGSTQRYVAVPSMNAICKHLAEGIEVVTQTQITGIRRNGDRLELVDDAALVHGPYDRVVVSAPAEQAAALLRDFPALSQPLAEIEMRPCWAAMLSFTEPLTDAWDGAFIHDSFLSWVARNSRKPERPTTAEHVVLHAEAGWTAAHWERDAEWVGRAMLEEFWRVSGRVPVEPRHLDAHRWKYALSAETANVGCYFDSAAGIVACGDWATGGRVEGAFLSGMAAAGRILGTLRSGEVPAEKRQLPLFEAQ